MHFRSWRQIPSSAKAREFGLSQPLRLSRCYEDYSIRSKLCIVGHFSLRWWWRRCRHLRRRWRKSIGVSNYHLKARFVWELCWRSFALCSGESLFLIHCIGQVMMIDDNPVLGWHCCLGNKLWQSWNSRCLCRCHQSTLFYRLGFKMRIRARLEFLQNQ